MPLPDLIEMEPLSGPAVAAVTIPGSKSVTNRALVLAALGQGITTLRGALWSEDTQVMVECLGSLGFGVTVAADPAEPANRTLVVHGGGGRIPRAGTPSAPLQLFVGNAGTAARFLAAMLCLGEGSFRLVGVPRMHERPQAELFDALRALGYRIDSPNGRLPAVVHGAGPKAGRCDVSVGESSQFASALILSAGRGGWEVAVHGGDEEELPYVDMTRRMTESFPGHGGTFAVEADASSCSYFWGADALLGAATARAGRIEPGPACTSGWQVDARFPSKLPLAGTISRKSDLGDSIMTAIVLAPFAAAPVTFVELGRLRVQECERVAALKVELGRCGAGVVEAGDTLTVFPSPLHGAEIETYRDHRMAMCFGMLGLRVPGMRIRDPGCVRKTFPNFFAKLASPPPQGLGGTIRDARTGARLAGDELLAD